MRKNWILVLFAVFLIAGLLCFGPIFQPVKAQQQPIESYSDDFSIDSGSWQYLGSTYRDQTNQYLVLTNNDGSRGGVAFFNALIQGSFTANFSYKSDGGDGFTIFFYKQKYSTLDTGGSLSFSSPSGIVPGYGIEFDSWQNIAGDFQSMPGSLPNTSGDPSAHHIALIEGYVGNHLAYVNDQRIADNNWHNVSVNVQASSVSVFVDEGLVLQWNGMLNRTYAGFGFSGANGSASGWHMIDDFSITSQNLQKPSLITSCRGSASASRFSAQINGNLTFNGTAVSGVPIFLSYSVTGGKSWQDLTLVNTGTDGSYSALWLPSVTGNYMIKAVYEGNESYLGAINIVNFAIEPYEEQSAFSVTTNSTISELSFNSTSKELSFSVSGDTGTTGYVDVYIPKSLINDITDLKVYLDGNQTEYTAQSQGDCWLLYFTYHHSTHSVMISIGSSSANPSDSPTQQPTLEPTQSAKPAIGSIVDGIDPLPYIIGIVAVGIVAIVGSAVYFAKFRKKKETN